MSGRWLAVAGLAVAAAAQAQDPGTPTVADAVSMLASDDAKRRDAAVETLAAARPEAVPEIVAAASSHVADAAVWSGLKGALVRWDGDSAADALSRVRVSWPEPARSRLDVLVHDLRLAKPLGPFPDFLAVAPEIDARVRATLAKTDAQPHYRDPSPDAEELSKLGRDAIPALLAALRERPKDESTRFAACTAADALGLIVADRDVALIRRLLEDGCVAAARSLRKLRSPAALDALVVAVERDVLDWDVLTSIESQGEDRRADLAVVGWVERNAMRRDVGNAAVFLARRRCDDAVPALERMLAANRDGYARASVAGAMADLGDAKGIDALVDFVEARGSAWARRVAGEALNGIVGRRVLVVSSGERSAPPAGNFDDAGAEFRRWWNANAERLVFDRDARRWRMPGDEAQALPESPPEVAARVRELLAKFDGENSYSAFNPEVREIDGLGRDAVPELLRQLRDGGERRGRGYARTYAVADALTQLVDETDVPALARLLAGGVHAAARCFEKLHCDAARDALLVPFGKGMGGYEVAQALRPYASDPVVQRAAVEWLRDFGSSDDSVGEIVAEFVAEFGGDDALAALRKLRAVGVASHSHAPVAAAIARLGGKDGIEALVALAASQDPGATDAANALNGISGRHVFTTRTFGPVGRTGNIDEASAWFSKWWDESKDGLRFDAARRRWTVGDAAPVVDVGTSPPDVAAQVAKIFAQADARRGFTSGSKDANALAALGRDSIPALVERIRASEPWSEHPAHSCWAAAEALRQLRTDADVEMLAGLLRDGHLAVASSLKGCRDPRARDALLFVVARGFDDMELMRALGTMPVDAATWNAIRAWQQGAGSNVGVWLGKYVEEHATPDAAPVLRELLARDGSDSVLRVRCAAGLASVGAKDGVEALVGIVDGPPSRSGWSQDARSMAASRLNSIAGERIFVESDRASPGTSYEDAAKQLRAWWASNAKELNFDAMRRVWVVGTPTRTVARAPVPSAFGERVQTILDDARAADSFMSGSPFVEPRDPHTRDLIALGHGAVPFIVTAIRGGSPWEIEQDRDDVTAASEALVVLAADDDRATMLELLGEGRLSVAPWFAKHPSPEGRAAVLGVVRRGFLDGALLDALRPFCWESPVHERLAAWARKYGAFEFGAVPSLAEILGTPLPGQHAPLLDDLLDRPIPAHTRWRIAAELAKHGVKPAVAALVSTFEKPAGLTDDDTTYVALAFNEIAGTKLVEISKDDARRPSFGPDRPPPRVVWFGGGPGVVKDQADAAQRVRKWWDQDGERLRFDDASGRWSTAK